MRKRGALAAVTALIVAGCGGSSHSSTTTTTATGPTPPKSGVVRVCSGLTDTCHTVQLSTLDKRAKAARVTPRAGCWVVDVSDYQGNVNWPATKGTICGGITKAGEGLSYNAGGQTFYRNWVALHQLGLWHSAYWFVRPGSCDTQAKMFVARLQSVGYGTDTTAGPLFYDQEKPGTGLASCFDHYVFAAFHRHGEIYTSPGTNPGGSHTGLGLWQAEYGSRLHPIWLPVNLWQCTDGVYGCVKYVPGIGYGDASEDLGVTKLTAGPQYTIFPRTVFKSHGVLLSEYQTVRVFNESLCKHGSGGVCKIVRRDAGYERDRIYQLVVADARKHHGKRNWGALNRGPRFATLTHIYES